MIMSDLKLNPTSLYSNTFNFQQIMFKYASLYIVKSVMSRPEGETLSAAIFHNKDFNVTNFLVL